MNPLSRPVVTALGIALTGSVLYHLAARAVSERESPLATLAGAYLTAAIASTFLAFTVERVSWARFAVSASKPPALMLAVSVVMIECGFLWAYRAGAAMGVASLLVNSTLAALLGCIGATLFHERPSILTVAGVGTCLIGTLMLISARN